MSDRRTETPSPKGLGVSLYPETCSARRPRTDAGSRNRLLSKELIKNIAAFRHRINVWSSLGFCFGAALARSGGHRPRGRANASVSIQMFSTGLSTGCGKVVDKFFPQDLLKRLVLDVVRHRVEL